jgi:trypsin-like peptidase
MSSESDPVRLQERHAKPTGLSAGQAAIAGAVLTVVGGVAGAFINAWSSQSIETGKSLTSLQIEELRTKGNLDIEKSKQLATESLERKKFETSLILEAIKTSSRADAIRNLKFFVAAGFVSDPDGKIARLSDESLPSISTPSQESAGRALRATGRIDVRSPGGDQFVCTGVGISPRHVVTASFCITGPTGRTTTNRNVEFKTGKSTFPLRLIKVADQSKLALLQVDSADQLDAFLDRTRVRDPLLGERVYLALSLPDLSVQLRTCEITKSAATENDFEYNCSTGPGSAGAIIIAVSDNALLGIHHSGRTSGEGEGGVAAKLSRALTELTSDLLPLDAQRRLR